MTQEPALIQLPETPSHEDCVRIYDQLMDARAGPVELSAEDVRKPGSLLVQMLVIAARDWASRDSEFSVTDQSDAFKNGLRLFGLDPSEFEKAQQV